MTYGDLPTIRCTCDPSLYGRDQDCPIHGQKEDDDEQ